MLRSSEEQFGIISSFASWLKISPMRLQFKSITRKADSDKHVAMVKRELTAEENEQCKHLGEGYIRLIKDVGSREALTRRFFLIFQYEELHRTDSDDFAKIYSALQTAEQTARAYFMQCGNSILQPKDPDEAAAEILYIFFNRQSCVDEPFASRVNRTKLKSIQDTSADYEELTNSIRAGYFIKNGIANNNEDLFYMSVFITISAKSCEELTWRKQQMTDMLKSMDMYTSDCRFQQEDALKSVMPFLHITPSLEKKSQRNVLTSGAASTYMFIILAITGILNPVVGALVHNAGSVLVIINSALLLKWRKRK